MKGDNVQYPVLVTSRMTREDAEYLEKMRKDGGEHQKLSQLVRSLLQAIIRDDKAAEGAK